MAKTRLMGSFHLFPTGGVMPKRGVLQPREGSPQVRLVGVPSFRLKNGCTRDDQELWVEKFKSVEMINMGIR